MQADPTPEGAGFVEPIIIIGIGLIVLVLLLWFGRRNSRPARLMMRGRFEEARTDLEQLLGSWMGALPGVAAASRYNLACCLIYQGRFEESLIAVEELGAKRLPPNMQYAILSLKAGALLMLERNPADVLRRLDEASRVREADYDLLRRAHALLSLGKTADAMSAFERAAVIGQGSTLGTTRLVDGEITQSLSAYLRGWFLHRLGRRDDARLDLVRAAQSPCVTVYVERARVLLASYDAPAIDEAEARSTLAPHVVP